MVDALPRRAVRPRAGGSAAASAGWRATIGEVAALRFERLMLGAAPAPPRRADRRWRLRLAITPDRARHRALTRQAAAAMAFGQGGGDLGMRMQRAMAACPAGPVVLVGTDIPALTRAHRRRLRSARRHDLVFGPGRGWRILARRRAASALPPLSAGAVVEPACAGGHARRSARRIAIGWIRRRRWTMSTTAPPIAGSRRCAGFESAIVSMQPRHQLDEVARAEAVVELVDEDPVPGVAAGAGRAGQREEIGAAGDPGGGAALDRRGADLLVAQPAEQLAEAGDLLLVDAVERLRGDVAAGDAGAAGRDHDVDLGIARSRPAAARRCRRIRRARSCERRCWWPAAVGELLRAYCRSGLRAAAARVRHGQQRDVDRRETGAFRRVAAWVAHHPVSQ